jgi:hypothetical protein
LVFLDWGWNEEDNVYTLKTHQPVVIIPELPLHCGDASGLWYIADSCLYSLFH